MGFFSKLKEGLAKTRQNFLGKLEGLFSGSRKIDEEFYEELEEILIAADVGVKTTLSLIEELRREQVRSRLDDPAQLKRILQEHILNILRDEDEKVNPEPLGTKVIMVVGVNGVGKTTTIGKLAYRFHQEGKTVLLGAGDTFRAAAIEQIEVWGQRVGAQVIKHQPGADPAAVAFDAVKAAKARGVDVLILDTAGRLHTKTNLMEELKKVHRVIGREMPGAPHEVLLVLDATTGQNAISQAKLFHEAVNITGIVLTKLDGTAKGGIVVAIRGELRLPVKYIGIGEGLEDLRPFDPEEFTLALFSREEE